MDKRRHGTLKKYGISQKRYKELKGFCEQYPEFLQELRNDVISPKHRPSQECLFLRRMQK